jgi:protein kinase-like protein
VTDPTAKTVVRELGGFSLLRELGEGGMGKVFLARQKSLDRKVALKVLLPELAKDEEFRTRFLREAKAAALFSHSHIVSVVDAGVDEAFGVHYIAFEFVEGGSLEDLLQEQPRLDEDRALDLSRGVLAGLAFAESKGIIHRDVKPDNVLVTPSGSPKLADLGLAKSPESMESQVTQTGVVLGTPLYMAPEQALGEDVLDIRADLYAWGLCLWRMLTGLMPFNEEGGCSSLQILTKHINEDLIDVRERNPAVSDDVAEFLRGLTARERDDRYPTAASALADIDRLLAGEALAGPLASADAPPAARPSSRVSRSARLAAKSAADTQVARGRGVSPGLLAGILIGAIGIGFGIALGSRGGEAPTPAASAQVALATPTPTPAAPTPAPPVPSATPTPEPLASPSPSTAVEVPPRQAPPATPTPSPPAPAETPAETPAKPAEPRLQSVQEVAEHLRDQHERLLRVAFAQRFPDLLAEVRSYRTKVVPKARPFLDTLVVAFSNLKAFALATDAETRESAARELRALEPGRGPIAGPLRNMLERLQRFVALTTLLRSFALDLGPDRVLNFQRQVLDTQSRKVLKQHSKLVQADGDPIGNADKWRKLTEEIANPASEVGHLGQAWALMSVIERINTWRPTFAEARASTGFDGAPQELLARAGEAPKGRGLVLFQLLRREARLRFLVRASGVIQAGGLTPSLLHTAIRDVWTPALQVFGLLLKRSDDSLSAVLLELHEKHVGEQFVERRLQRVEKKDEFAPAGALGLVATGDLGKGNLEVYFKGVSRKLKLAEGSGKLGSGSKSVRVRVPTGGILRTAVEPTPKVLWVAQDLDGRPYSWKGKTWDSGTPYKIQAWPKGGKAFWTLSGEDPQGSLEQELALHKELAGQRQRSSAGDGMRGKGRGKGKRPKLSEIREKVMDSLSEEELEHFQSLRGKARRRFIMERAQEFLDD